MEEPESEAGRAAQYMEMATASLREARRQHFLRELPEAGRRLEEAAGYLRRALDGAERLPPESRGNERLRAALAAWSRERQVAEAGHAHAEAWAGHWLPEWMQALGGAGGLDGGYSNRGRREVAAEPVRIRMEG